MRGADTKSDHHLLLAKLQLKLFRTKRKVHTRKHFDVGRLHNPEVGKCTLEVRNWFQALNTDDDIDDYWIKVKHIYTESVEGVLGVRQKANSDWISETTYRRINGRKNINVKIGHTRSTQPTERLQSANTKSRTSKSRQAQGQTGGTVWCLAMEAEEAVCTNKISSLYQLTR